MIAMAGRRHETERNKASLFSQSDYVGRPVGWLDDTVHVFDIEVCKITTDDVL